MHINLSHLEELLRSLDGCVGGCKETGATSTVSGERGCGRRRLGGKGCVNQEVTEGAVEMCEDGGFL